MHSFQIDRTDLYERPKGQLLNKSYLIHVTKMGYHFKRNKTYSTSSFQAVDNGTQTFDFRYTALKNGVHKTMSLLCYLLDITSNDDIFKRRKSRDQRQQTRHYFETSLLVELRENKSSFTVSDVLESSEQNLFEIETAGEDQAIFVHRSTNVIYGLFENCTEGKKLCIIDYGLDQGFAKILYQIVISKLELIIFPCHSSK